MRYAKEAKALCAGCRMSVNLHDIPGPDGYKLRYCTQCGLTSVVDPITNVSYDGQYVADRYDKYDTTDRMSVLRLAFVETVLRLYDGLPSGILNPFSAGYTLLDIGYGNGSFIRWATQNGWNAYGSDVNPTPYDGVRQIDLPEPGATPTRFRAITLFDTLEHFETFDKIRKVAACTDWLFVTAPLPPVGWPRLPANWNVSGREQENMDVLRNWKHWRPGEHHHVFGPHALPLLFTHRLEDQRVQVHLEHVSHFEDVIRKPQRPGQPNTFTAALRCRVLPLGR